MRAGACIMHVVNSIGEALDAALALAGPEDAVCAWGSLYSVGELRHCLGLC